MISLQKLTYTSSQNVKKAIYNMQHVLAVDPSRRFSYGINIEGTELGLWIATRAMVIACDTFDFRTVSLLEYIYVLSSHFGYVSSGTTT